MDLTRFADCFLQPTDPLHRQYEALRAVFVEQQPVQDVAQRLGYRYDTVRALVSRFRRPCDAAQLPPFRRPSTRPPQRHGRTAARPAGPARRG
jgi:hypothetical protein